MIFFYCSLVILLFLYIFIPILIKNRGADLDIKFDDYKNLKIYLEEINNRLEEISFDYQQGKITIDDYQKMKDAYLKELELIESKLK